VKLKPLLVLIAAQVFFHPLRAQEFDWAQGKSVSTSILRSGETVSLENFSGCLPVRAHHNGWQDGEASGEGVVMTRMIFNLRTAQNFFL
jgi:hypothetical protein